MNGRFMAMGALWLLASVANAQSSNRAEGPVGAALQNREPVAPIPRPPRARKAMANTYRNDADALRDGRHLFVSFNCSGCHGDHAGGGMGPSLRDEDWIDGSDAA